jgi:hypothetical protein
MGPPFSCANIAPAYLPLYRLGFATPAANFANAAIAASRVAA